MGTEIMLRIASAVALAVLCTLPLGCGRSCNGLEERAIAPFLPEYFTLSTPLVQHSWEPDRGGPTICDKLKELGARVRDGKLCDASGKEIRFVIRHGGGDTSRFMERQAEERAEVAELNKQYTVVVLFIGQQ
jgi:hypothetical protein